MNKKELVNLFVKNYQDNQNFIDKWTFTAALGSIPLAIQFTNSIDKLTCYGKGIFLSANYFAGIVVIAHIVGAVCGKRACNAYLSKNNDKGEYYARWQRFYNIVVNLAFCLMIVSYLIIMNKLVWRI